jgi:hypothetical protein
MSDRDKKMPKVYQDKMRKVTGEEVEEAKSPSYEVDIIAKDFIKQGAKSKDAYKEAMKLAKKMSNREKQDIIKKGKSSLMYLKLKEEVALDEGYEGEVKKVLKRARIEGYFSNGILYVERGDGKAAMAALKKAPNIKELPKVREEKPRSMYREEFEINELGGPVRPMKDRFGPAKPKPKPQDEGRGRPRKDGTASDDREHIQMQLRKSISMRGAKEVEFADGKKVKVKPHHASAVLRKISSIKQPRDKQNAVNHITKSHKNMMDFHNDKAGEIDPAKRKKAAMDVFKK